MQAIKEPQNNLTDRDYALYALDVYKRQVLDTAFYQISYFAHPQGQLLNDLDKAVNDMDACLLYTSRCV